MIASIIGLAASLAAQAGSGIASAMQNKKQRRMAQDEAARQNAFFAKQYYTDAMNKPQYQNVLRTLNQQMDKETKKLDNTAAVQGLTADANLAARKNALEQKANVVSDIYAQDAIAKDQLAQQWEQARQNQYATMNNIEDRRHQTYMNMANNAANLGSSALAAFGNNKTTEG